ncbi:polymorphic toxin-type HINT domain-containing protein [Acinetobacter nectaris]|uniref:polymorphic toxin-type HINT domain-containing protein n=1 Tax=Acinetobacter nectaris TaxID=1219382 RepID=UPI001F376CC1|nr:hypothetical protein [Acinetobacter nectaris]
MKNTFLYLIIFIFCIFSIESRLQAGTVDLSHCNAQSSFAIVTQSEGPTYACGGIDTGVGNPINVLNGNKFEQVDDFKAPPAFEGLSFSRYYNSHSHALTNMGYGWYSSFDIKLYEQSDIIQIRLETGQRLNFVKTKVFTDGQSYQIRGYTLNHQDGWVERRIDGSGWIWHRGQAQYHFESGNKDQQLGNLTQIRNEKGAIYTLRYDVQDRLTRVENGHGDALNWHYKFTSYGLPQITLTTPIGDYQYFLDRQNNLVQVVYPNGERLQYAYQGKLPHQLTSKWRLDANRHQWQLETRWRYDQWNRAIVSEHANGVGRVEISYDPRTAGTLVAEAHSPIYKNTVVNRAGETTEYEYQIVGTQYQLLKVSSAQGQQRYQYNSQGLVIQSEQFDAHQHLIHKIALEYNANREVIARTLSGKDLAPQRTRYEYANSYQKNLLGQQIEHRHLIHEQRDSVFVGQHYEKNYQYNEQDQLIAIEEIGYTPWGEKQVRRNEYGYDPLGRLIWEGQDQAHHSQYQYQDNSDNVSQITYANQQSITINYDEWGYIKDYRGLDGINYHLQHDAAGHLTTIESQQGRTLIHYNQAGKIKEIANALGQTMAFDYDAANQLQKVSDQQHNQIQLIKNSEGRITGATLISPTGTIEDQMTVDENTVTQTSALANTDPVTPNLEAQSLQRIQHILQPLNDLRWTPPPAKTEYALDRQGRSTRYDYNDFGDLVQINSPVTGMTQYQYDSLGAVIQEKHADQSHVDYTRDLNGRITHIRAYNASGQEDEHGEVIWGNNNKPSQIRYRAGEEQFKYNDMNQLTEHETFIAGVHYCIRYRYNSLGQLIEKILPNGQVIQYQYRGANHPRAGLLEGISVKNGLFHSLDQSVISDLNSATDDYQKSHYNYGNGLLHEERKDQQGRIIQSGNPYTGETSLSYLDDLDIQNKQQQRQFLGQIAPEQIPVALSQQASNLLQPLQHMPAPMPVQEQQLQHLNDLTHYGDMYDALGRQRWLSQDGDILQFHYDSLNRLIQVDRQHDQATILVAKYQYNLFGQRLSKTIVKQHGKQQKTTYTFYDGSQLVAESDATGKIQTSYIWMNDTPIGLLQQGELYFIHVDHRQAPLAVTNSQRQVVWQAHISDDLYATPLETNQGRLGLIQFNLRGSNQYFDEESHLHYNTYRYFDAQNHRYLTPDPFGLAAGPDLYTFALNQPHLFKDELGLAPTQVPNKEFKDAEFNDKLSYFINKTSDNLKNSDKNVSYIADTIRNLVSKENIAVFGGIFGVWASLHVVGVGFAADAIASAALYFMAGKAAYQFGFDLGTAIYGLMTATCWKDLDPIADKFAAATRTLVLALAAGAAGKVAEVSSKVSGIFDKIRSTLGEYQQKFGSQTLKRYDDMAREFVQKRVGGDAAGARKLCDCCFIAGTLVWTPAGLKPIENIQRGEQVYSLSDQSQGHGKPELKAVVDTIITPPKVTYRIHYGYGQTSGDIQASDNHPFFIQNRGWLNTLQLQPGMKLVDAQHHQQTIRSITVDNTPVTTYNLTVLDDHTFFVGKNKVWVHNAGKKCACNSESEELPKLSDDPKDSLSKKGLNEPVKLTPAERETVEKWAALRFEYIKKIEKEDYSVIQDPILRQAITRAENSIRDSMTADDLAAILKESRTPPVQILKDNGKPYDHIKEGEDAYNAITKALFGKNPEKSWQGSNIKKRLGELEKRNQTDSAEYQLLQSKQAELTGLRNKYVEYAPEVLNRINQRKNNG